MGLEIEGGSFGGDTVCSGRRKVFLSFMYRLFTETPRGAPFAYQDGKM